MTHIDWTVDLKNAAGEVLTQLDVEVEVARDCWTDELYVERINCDGGVGFHDGRPYPNPPATLDGSGLEGPVRKALNADSDFWTRAQEEAPTLQEVARYERAEAWMNARKEEL